MRIKIGTLLNDYEIYKLKKYLKGGKPRTATLILYLACRKAYPKIDFEQLYRACWDKILTKFEKYKQQEQQLKLISA
jgi:hypothetical protein